MDEISSEIYKLLTQQQWPGNIILREMCIKYSLLDNEDHIKLDEEMLSSQMWLIGRSYAASPQRRRYSNSSEEKIVNDVTAQKFFSAVADHIISQYIGKGFFHQKDLLRAYSLDSSEEDVNVLTAVVKAVILFSQSVMAATYSFDHPNACKNAQACLDMAKNAGLTEPISFASKFLHFHFPRTVFIYDSVSSGHFRQMDTERVKNEVNRSGGQLTAFYCEFLKDYRNLEKQLENSVRDVARKNFTVREKEYIRHIVREYLLATHIASNMTDSVENDGATLSTLPRKIDNVMMRTFVIY